MLKALPRYDSKWMKADLQVSLLIYFTQAAQSCYNIKTKNVFRGGSVFKITYTLYVRL